MGYYIFSYGIKTDQILNAFGSKDSTLQKEVEENDVFQNYSDFEVDDSKTSTNQALIDIIQSNSFNTKSDYAYGYAFISLCATLGKGLPYEQEIKLGYETDLINKVLTEDFNITNLDIKEFLLNNSILPFPLPKIVEWPLIGLIRQPQLQELKTKLLSLNITEEQIAELEDDPEDREFTYTHLKGILDNINYCLDNNLELISFCH